MPRRRFPAALPKRATNVSVRSDLLAAAGEAGLNLSATLERELMEELAVAQRRKWREDNRDSIQAYNEHVEKHGAFSDDVRRFWWRNSPSFGPKVRVPRRHTHSS